MWVDIVFWTVMLITAVYCAYICMRIEDEEELNGEYVGMYVPTYIRKLTPSQLHALQHKLDSDI